MTERIHIGEELARHRVADLRARAIYVHDAGPDAIRAYDEALDDACGSLSSRDGILKFHALRALIALNGTDLEGIAGGADAPLRAERRGRPGTKSALTPLGQGTAPGRPPAGINRPKGHPEADQVDAQSKSGRPGQDEENATQTLQSDRRRAAAHHLPPTDDDRRAFGCLPSALAREGSARLPTRLRRDTGLRPPGGLVRGTRVEIVLVDTILDIVRVQTEDESFHWISPTRLVGAEESDAA